jgi:ATP-dependent helicase/DNAse subunit B
VLGAEISGSLDRLFDEVTLPASASQPVFAMRAMELIDAFDVEGCLKRVDDTGVGVAALKAFRELLEAMAKDSSGVERAIGDGELIEEVERAVSAIQVQRPATESSVIAQEAHGLRPRRYRAVFVLGLVEGEFPARVAERFPYTMAEREGLRRDGVDLVETTSDAGADVTAFYKAMASATERLYLSYARADTAGGELLRSYLIDEVIACAPVHEARLAGQAASLDRLRGDDVISLEELSIFTARRMSSGQGATRLRAAQSRLEGNLRSWRATLRGASVARGRIRGDAPARFMGRIEDGRLRGEINGLIGADHRWSATQINDYGVCPFRFFARQLLRLSRADEPVEGFIPTRLGTAYHRILERTHTQLNRQGLRLSADTVGECAALAEGISDETLEEMVAEGEIRKGVFWEFEKVEIKRHVVRLLAQEAEWRQERQSRPVAFEQKFGLAGNPPLVIESADESVKICGVIDRIDEGEDGITVVDYKTTRTPIRHADALDGRNLQLPIYIMAAKRLGLRSSVVAGFYLHITSRKKGSEIGPGERLSVEEAIARAEEKILAYTTGARKGLFPVLPNNNRCYSGCEYEALCRISEV